MKIAILVGRKALALHQRDRQRERLKMGQPYSYAKNFGTFCPMGPWVVTSKEIGDPRNLKMEVRINGKVTRAEILEGAERDRLYAKQAELYPGFAEYQEKTDRQIPVFVVERPPA